MEGADVRRAVAEERNRHARLVAQLERQPRADDRRQAAADDGVRTEVAALDVVEVHRAAVPVRAALDLPVELGHHRVGGRAARERVAVRAMRGREHVAVLHRAADADRHRFLADRDMQEAGQLAGAKPLLDLFFEAPNQQHVVEKLRQLLLRKLGLLLDPGHGASVVILSVRESRLPVECDRERPPADWSDVQLRVSIESDAEVDRAAQLLGPASPAAAAATSGSTASAAGPASTLTPSPGYWAASTASGSGDGWSWSGAAPPLPPRPSSAGRSPPNGTPRSRRSRPTGATCSQSSGCRRATTSTAPPCSRRR